VRGEQKWFAQCGFEAASATWLFPGRTVRIEASCLDCGDTMLVEMRDGRAERRAVLERLGKTSPFWLGTPAPS
jgi:hypothetical protein